MTGIRHLVELVRDGDPDEQEFGNYFVASKLEVDPLIATSADYDKAWKIAQNQWERRVQRFLREGCNIKEAEMRARLFLLRVALARLETISWPPPTPAR